jgi:hypothetical protein
MPSGLKVSTGSGRKIDANRWHIGTQDGAHIGFYPTLAGYRGLPLPKVASMLAFDRVVEPMSTFCRPPQVLRQKVRKRCVDE